MQEHDADEGEAAVSGRAVSRITADGDEIVAVGLCLPPDLTDEERALAIHEGFMAAKALLCANTLH